MARLTDKQYEEIFERAFKAAAEACDGYLTRYPGQWYPCGFAWVVLGGRDPAVNYLKKNKERYGRLAGDKGYPKGWHIWDPANSGTQCMEAKVEGARAFAKVMQDAGIDCYADCRMD